MIIDQETTTTETETYQTTVSETQDKGSSTSTTEAETQTDDDEDVDLSKTGDETTKTDDDEDTRTDEERAADEEREALFGAPEGDEAYALEGLPEGMEIDAAALEAITPALKQLGLSNKGASLIAGVYAEKVLPGVMERAVGAIETQVTAQRTEWEGQARDAVQKNGQELKNATGDVLSFDAKDLKAVRSVAAKALDHLAPEGFREFLHDTGLSVHPAMLAFAYQAGKLLAEDTDLETTERGDKRPKSRADKYYGTQG